MGTLSWDTPTLVSGATESSIPNLHLIMAESLVIPSEVEANIRRLPYGSNFSAVLWKGYKRGSGPFSVCLVDDGRKVINLDKHSELLFILTCFVIFRDCGKSDWQEVALRIALGLIFICYFIMKFICFLCRKA